MSNIVYYRIKTKVYLDSHSIQWMKGMVDFSANILYNLIYGIGNRYLHYNLQDYK